MTPRRPRGHATPRNPADLSPRGLSCCNAMTFTPRVVRPRETPTRGVKATGRHILTPRGRRVVHPRGVSICAATTSTPRLFTPLKGGPAESRGVPPGERARAELSPSGRLTSPQLWYPFQPGAGGHEINAAHPGGQVRGGGAVRSLRRAGSAPLVLRERDLNNAKTEGAAAPYARRRIYRYARRCFVVTGSMVRDVQKVEVCPAFAPAHRVTLVKTESATALRAIALYVRSGIHDR